MPGLTSVAAVAAGGSHVLAPTSGGLVYAWGSNASRQVCNQRDECHRPVLLGLTGVIAIAAGDAHSVAPTNDGNVWVRGSGANGRLGTGNTSTVTTPTMLAALSNVTAISARRGHTMVRESDSTVWVFGYNAQEQLGQGNTTDSLKPIQVPSISTATGIAANHSLIPLSDGTVKACGYNWFGQVGDNTNFNRRNSLVTVSSLTSVGSVVAGGNHPGALKADGTLRLWGLVTNGQIGDVVSNPVNRLVPTTPLAPSTAAHLTLGSTYTLAATSTGVVYTVGSKRLLRAGRRHDASQVGAGHHQRDELHVEGGHPDLQYQRGHVQRREDGRRQRSDAWRDDPLHARRQRFDRERSRDWRWRLGPDRSDAHPEGARLERHDAGLERREYRLHPLQLAAGIVNRLRRRALRHAFLRQIADQGTSTTFGSGPHGLTSYPFTHEARSPAGKLRSPPLCARG